MASSITNLLMTNTATLIGQGYDMHLYDTLKLQQEQVKPTK